MQLKGNVKLQLSIRTRTSTEKGRQNYQKLPSTCPYSEPLLKNLGLLNVHDLYHITILKFYYKLVHTELHSYFNRYLPVFRNENRHDQGYTLRLGVSPLIRAPRVHHVFAEVTVLYQIVKLINQINIHEPRLLDIINNKTHSWSGLFCYAKLSSKIQLYM